MNDNNLKSFKTYSSEEHRTISSKGGKASARARAERKTMREALITLLENDIKVDNVTMTGIEAISLQLFNKALTGDIKAIALLRDTIGEKPKEVIEKQVVPTVDLTDEQIERILGEIE